MKKIPVSTAELIDLLKVLEHYSTNNGFLTIDEFYSISRICLIKDLKYFDEFDIVFAETFKGLVTGNSEFKSLLEEWLNKAIEKEISEKEKLNAPDKSYEEVLEDLKKRLEEQKERHDGGNRWIGTKGTSPFGNSGFNPNGMRISGDTGNRTAFDTIAERKYRDYRTDETLNVRQIKVALKKLKKLKKEGRIELSIDKTIDATCKNCGDLELIFERSRKNDLKLLLLMDVGGSMSPYAQRVSKLFSASHQINHFKEFHYYYFHNIIYDCVYTDASLNKRITVETMLKKFRPDTRIIYVGDASMHPYELFNKVGMNDYYGYYYHQKNGTAKNVKTGYQTLKQLTEFYPYSIWINPEDRRYWQHETVEAIWDLVPMYFLSVEGLERGIDKLKTG